MKILLNALAPHEPGGLSRTTLPRSPAPRINDDGHDRDHDYQTEDAIDYACHQPAFRSRNWIPAPPPVSGINFSPAVMVMAMIA
ncbi:hypothetical protein MKK75_06840 [Methylobacterium sp. J-030]|uniref:hypothetical protein n=1 Tax=Methylobacterium sp. J-030 TaxID=2836627 RepID=UPI001FB93CA8|nr:hypothetical protein [Methylobacterium sp. J-030]MCJ2068522.1 hypothetical protein [Methylobacterium sp. J-030]